MTGDFQEALAALLGKDAPNLSPAVITRLLAEWQADYDAWQKRDLSARRYVYVWADGVYLQARMEGAAECMLVLIGATPEGKKEFIGFQTGVRESAQSWRELLIDIKRRGLEIAPDLAVGDGALGFWKAIDEVFPSTRHQRCWVHKTANVLNKVALSVQINMKADLREIYGAATATAKRSSMPSISSRLMEKIFDHVHCSSGRICLPGCSVGKNQRSSSTNTSPSMDLRSLPMPVSSGWRASYPSVSTPPTAQGGIRPGSRSAIRQASPFRGSAARIGTRHQSSGGSKPAISKSG